MVQEITGVENLRAFHRVDNFQPDISVSLEIQSTTNIKRLVMGTAQIPDSHLDRFSGGRTMFTFWMDQLNLCHGTLSEEL